MQKRRYEILLPLEHNDGRPVDPGRFEKTRQELVARFGALTFLPQAVLGTWSDEERQYEDKLIRVIVDVEDTPEHRQFLEQYKSTLLERFEQIEVYIVSYPVEIL